MKRFCLLIAMSVLSAFAAKSQEVVSFMNLGGVTESLPVRCMEQDSTGLVWLGTVRGLFSYDGYDLRRHTSDSSSTRTMITAAEYDGGRLYLGYTDELMIFRTSDRSFFGTGLRFESEIKALLSHGDHIYIGADNLYRYNPYNGEVETLLPEPPVKDSFSGISSLATDGKVLYIGKRNEVLALEFESGNIRPLDLKVFIATSLHCIADTLLVGTPSELLAVPLGGGESELLGTFDGVKDILTDARGRIMVATDNGFSVQTESAGFRHLRHSTLDVHSLANDVVWQIAPDRDGNFWLCTDDGISIIESGNSITEIPLNKLTGSDYGNRIRDIIRDTEGYLWMCGDHGIIRTAPDGSCRWYRVDTQESRIPHNSVRAFTVTRDSVLLAAADVGVLVYDASQEQFSTVRVQGHTMWTYDVAECVDGTLWLATYDGLGHITRQGQVLEWFNEKDGLPDNSLSTVALDKAGNVWSLGANNALSCLYADRTVRGFGYADSMTGDSDGVIWAGDGDIIRKLDAQGTESEYRIGGNPGAEIFGMSESRRAIWVVSSDGLHMVEKDNPSDIRHMQVSRNYTSIYCDKESRFTWLGGSDIVVQMNPRLADESAQGAHGLAVTELVVNGRVHPVKPGKTVLESSTRNISVHFTDYNYSSKKLAAYNVKLSGYDAEWRILPPGANVVSYSNLLPGNYRLDIAANPEERGESVSVKFRIKRPWYFSNVMLLLYLAATVGFFFLARMVVRERRKILADLHKLSSVLHLRRKNIEEISAPQLHDEISQDEQFLRKVTDCIDKHIDDTELSVAGLSELCNTTPKQLYRKIKDLTGQTAVEYIRSIRLKKAAQLFASGSYTVSEVMYMVGFSNPSYFTRSFKAEFGKTPKEFISKA